MQAFYGTRISEHISESPEGFLICHSAPLARTAVRVPQKYRGSELGLPTDDMVDVYRSPREVLSKKFLASLEGKPVTDAHPPQFLSADNVAWYQRGHVQNVRPGPLLPDGEQSVVGDLVVTDAALIAKIKAGIRGLSVGYQYDVNKDDHGNVTQRNLAANHVAVVPEARAGQHVRIMDAAPEENFYAMLARYHRVANPATVTSSKSRRAADSAGEPRSWDELATELRGLMGPRGEEETMSEEKLSDQIKRLCALVEQLVAARGSSVVEDDAPEAGYWADDATLADLRKLRPFIQASGDRKVIDAFNSAVRNIKSQPRHLVTDALDSIPRITREAVLEAARDYPGGDRAAAIQAKFEDDARRYHRRNFHIREDKEQPRSEEPTVRVAEDGRTRSEAYADRMNRAGAEMRRKKK